MPQPNPTLSGEDWDLFQKYVDVEYDPKSWGNRHWTCPGCGQVTSVKRDICVGCGSQRVQKIFRYTRLGNPVKKWVMLK